MILAGQNLEVSMGAKGRTTKSILGLEVLDGNYHGGGGCSKLLLYGQNVGNLAVDG